jgi:hypothetical protein
MLGLLKGPEAKSKARQQQKLGRMVGASAVAAVLAFDSNSPLRSAEHRSVRRGWLAGTPAKDCRATDGPSGRCPGAREKHRASIHRFFVNRRKPGVRFFWLLFLRTKKSDPRRSAEPKVRFKR